MHEFLFRLRIVHADKKNIASLKAVYIMFSNACARQSGSEADFIKGNFAPEQDTPEQLVVSKYPCFRLKLVAS